MPKKTDQVIQPIEASLDEVADGLVISKKTLSSKKPAKARGQLQATHKGSFQGEFGIDVECYVLDDEQKTAVISQRGMGPALGLSAGSGGRLKEFVQSATISPYVGRELQEKLDNPIVFQAASAVGSSIANGYDVTLLIDLCKTVIQAESEGKLKHARYKNIIRQAHVILAASAKAGIKGLVYALSGYDATKQDVIAAFKFYVREEAREYEREFPEELYNEWYRLYELPRPERNRPWKFKHLTEAQVYEPLARSKGTILGMTREKREKARANPVNCINFYRKSA
ncbi:P63C domain-containing protein [Nevskia sp.]|uniref:P63C domain-containing protein n=1 Tax=Nevskia sp. TaxID=1929292 RepID=UPI003F728922